jgi:hypothetical protein
MNEDKTGPYILHSEVDDVPEDVLKLLGEEVSKLMTQRSTT